MLPELWRMDIASGIVSLKLLRQLHTERPLVAGGGAFLAAGSAITQFEDRFQIVADDALDLVSFACDSDAPGKLTRLFQRADLPADEKARKKVKPDLESATIVGQGETATWIGLGSGSTARRSRGVFCKPGGEPQEFEAAPLFDWLRQQHPQLNIEGLSALPEHNRLRLAQRGNGEGSSNAIIDLDLKRAQQYLQQGKAWGPELVISQKTVELPKWDHVPITLTDLTPLDGGRCLFTGAAEDTDNPYDDGQVKGSVIGVLELDGQVSQLQRVDLQVKLEGITARRQGEQVQAWVVSDNDDPHQAASLYEAWLHVKRM